MLSISKLTSSIVPGSNLISARNPPLPPMVEPPHGGIDPRYRAIGTDTEVSYFHYFRKERLGTGKLSELDGLTRWKARFDHFVNGPAFPEYHDGLMKGRLIEGTDGNDRIEVRYEPSTGGAYVSRVKEIRPDGASISTWDVTTHYLNADEARFLRITGGAGHDQITVDPRFPYSVHLMGGEGNDYLVGGAGNDILEGGTGDDTVVGNSGLDRAFFADAGRDEAYLGTDQHMEE